MKLSDLIRALEHIRDTQGDLQVLQERIVDWDTYELFPDAIDVDKGVVEVASYAWDADKRRYEPVRRVYRRDDKKDLRVFPAFVLGGAPCTA